MEGSEQLDTVQDTYGLVRAFNTWEWGESNQEVLDGGNSGPYWSEFYPISKDQGGPEHEPTLEPESNRAFKAADHEHLLPFLSSLRINLKATFYKAKFLPMQTESSYRCWQRRKMVIWGSRKWILKGDLNHWWFCASQGTHVLLFLWVMGWLLKLTWVLWIYYSVFLNYNLKNMRSCQILLSVSTAAFMSLFFKYQS